MRQATYGWMRSTTTGLLIGFRFNVVLALASLLFVVGIASAQSGAGNIGGCVADASSGALPGTTVVLRNTQTGVALTSMPIPMGGIPRRI